jgi:hypothetical protein
MKIWQPRNLLGQLFPDVGPLSVGRIKEFVTLKKLAYISLFAQLANQIFLSVCHFSLLRRRCYCKEIIVDTKIKRHSFELAGKAT